MLNFCKSTGFWIDPLKPEGVALFLEFCDADPKSKNILDNNNPLSLMDFILTKNEEFKKLAETEKK